MRLTLTTAPTEQPATVEFVKLFGRIDGGADDADAVVSVLIDAATRHLDGPSGLLGRAIITQDWTLELATWPTAMLLPLEPIQSVDVRYIDTSGDEQQLSPESFVLSSQPRQRVAFDWQSGLVLPELDATGPYPVKIIMTAGFGGADAVPADIKVLIGMFVSLWYDHPNPVAASGSVAVIPEGLSSILSKNRVHL